MGICVITSQFQQFHQPVCRSMLASSALSVVDVFSVSKKAGLSYDTNETVLKETFGEFGNIIEVSVICNHKSGKSKGYGFVRFDSETAASKALEELNGKLVDGKNIRVYYAHKQTNMPIKREA